MKRSGATTGKLEVELDSLITLVAKSLYSDRLTCVRELLANATDALTRKKIEIQEHGLQDDGRYECRVGYDPTQAELVFRDTGWGLDIDEIRDVLTRVGASGTRQFKEGKRGDGGYLRQLIGQFGIGLLSAYVLSESLTVTTRRYDLPEGQGARFTCTSSGQYRIDPLPVSFTGTEVRLRIQDPRNERLVTEQLEDRIRAYALLLPYPVKDVSGVTRFNLDPDEVPWRDPRNAMQPARLERFLSQNLRINRPLYAIPILPADDFEVGGIIYVPADPSHFNTRLACDLYCRGMLVRKGSDGLLPDGAVFFAGVIECRDLTPIASREDVVRDDVYARLQRAVHRQLLVGLANLRRAELAATLESLMLVRGREVKRLMGIDETHFDDPEVPGTRTTLMTALAPKLRFQLAGQSNHVSLADYIEDMKRRDDEAERANVYYSGSVRSVGGGFSIDQALQKKGLRVLVLSDPPSDHQPSLDAEILKRFAVAHGYRLVTAESRKDLFEEVSGAEWKRLSEIVLYVASTSSIRPDKVDHVVVRTTAFDPEDMPLLILTPSAGALRDALQGVRMDEIKDRALRELLENAIGVARESLEADERTVYYFLNSRSSIIKRMTECRELDSKAGYAVVRELIHLALEYSGYAFPPGALKRLRDARLPLLEAMIENLETIEEKLGPKLL